MKSLLSELGPAVVINLKSREDKKKYIIDHFNQHGVTDYSFFDAVDGRAFGNTYKMSPGQIGCAMSHILVISKWLNESSGSYLLVMEDDICLDNVKFWSWSWEEFIKKINFDFDIIQLSTWPYTIKTTRDLGKNSLPHKLLTTAYLISRSGAKQIIDKTFQDGKIKLDFNDTSNIADHSLLYKNVKKCYTIPFFSPTTKFLSDIDTDSQVAELQKMESQRTSGIWQTNSLSIDEILELYKN